MFFKTTLTVPKIKDLVNSPNQKYQNIYDTISHKFDSYSVSNINSNSYTSIDLLPIPSEKNSMKDELKSFLKKQLNNDNTVNDNTVNDNIMTIDSLTRNNFSSY